MTFYRLKHTIPEKVTIASTGRAKNYQVVFLPAPPVLLVLVGVRHRLLAPAMLATLIIAAICKCEMIF